MTFWEASLFKVETVACGPMKTSFGWRIKSLSAHYNIKGDSAGDSPSVQGAAVSWAVQVKSKAMYELSDHFLPKCEEGAWL